MPQRKVSHLLFPVGGLHRGVGYQRQPPFTTPDALNVRPRDTLELRARGGSRPGIAKAYYTQLGGGNPVRMLGSVRYLVADGLTYTNDDFDGAALSSSMWTAATWVDASLPSILTDYASVSYNTARGAVRTAITSFDTSQAYQIDLWISPYGGSHNGKYQIFGRMNDTTPLATTDGFVAELVMEDATGAYAGTLKTYDATTPTSYNLTGGTLSAVKGGWFSCLYNGGTITVSWNGVTLLTQACAFGAGAGHRMGFGLNCTVAGGVCLADEFRVQYRTNNKTQTITAPIVASSNGLLYKESYAGALAQVSTSATLASDRQLMCVDRGQKLYIADNGNPCVTGTDGTVTAGVLDAAGVSDWTTLGISTYDHVVVVTASLAGMVDSTYTIDTIHATNGLTLTGAGALTGTCAYRVERCPKVYDPVAATLTKLTAGAALGQVPSGCPLMALFKDCLWLAGNPLAPQGWYACRQGATALVPFGTDWDYAAAATDGGRAVAGTSTNTGQLGEPITALAAWSNDYLLFGCRSSLWVLRGHPAYGGQFENLSRNIGVAGKKAWCFGPNGEFVWLSANGLYAMGAGASGTPQAISIERLPKELVHVDGNTHHVSLAYDVESRGVHIFLTPLNASQRLHWYLDWTNKSFWPVRIPGVQDPHDVFEYAGIDAADAAVLLACRDGYIRKFRADEETDDGTTITSYVQVGPLMLGDGYRRGLLNEIVGVLDGSSGNATVTVHSGETAEASVSAAAVATETFVAGRNFSFRPRAGGGAACVKMANAAARAWAFEQMRVVIERLGVHRKQQ